MMHEFLAANRLELERRCREKLPLRTRQDAGRQQAEQGIALFIDQLIGTLKAKADGAAMARPSTLERNGAHHGADLLAMGYSIHQMAHGYGAVCQAVSDLAQERNELFTVDEFLTINRCLDKGITDAVDEFSLRHELRLNGQYGGQANERLGVFADELRKHLESAALALTAIRSGDTAPAGADGADGAPPTPRRD
ncbi:MAG: hypothetical protein V4462_03045 [Pseudomonadota bacterium]